MNIISYIKYIKNHRNSKGELVPWVIISHDTGKILASFKTKKEAEEHLKRMQYFKQVKNGFIPIILRMGVNVYMELNKICSNYMKEIIKTEYDLFEDLLLNKIISEEKIMEKIPEIGESLRNLVVKYLENELSYDDLKEKVKELLK